MAYRVVLLACASLLILGVMPISADDCDFLINVVADISQYPPTPSEEMWYHDGTAFWLTWSGMYRGTWFNVYDFDPSPFQCNLEEVEFWFYHHPTYQWDTSDFYAEIWTGDYFGPVNELDSRLSTAIHYAPTQIIYSSSINTGYNFWALVDTEISAGGWPSLLSDIGPNFTGHSHSFVSSDFFIWEPWVGGEACANLVSLEHISWGAIKVLF